MFVDINVTIRHLIRDKGRVSRDPNCWRSVGLSTRIVTVVFGRLGRHDEAYRIELVLQPMLSAVSTGQIGCQVCKTALICLGKDTAWWEITFTSNSSVA